MSEIKTLSECYTEVAKKHGLGLTLVTGHRVGYFSEAAELYAAQFQEDSKRKSVAEVRGEIKKFQAQKLVAEKAVLLRILVRIDALKWTLGE